MISFDEWNVWYQDRVESHPPTGDNWPVAPVLLEDHYNVADAVVVGNLLISLLKHSDRVHAACLAQLVNVIAPIMTEPGGKLWKQTSFYPFALTARYAAGDVLSVPIECDTYCTNRFGDVPVIDATATFDAKTNQTAIFLVNRSLGETTDVRLNLRHAHQQRVLGAELFSSSDFTWQASAEDDTTVGLSRLETQYDENSVVIPLPPVSWAVVRLTSD